MGVVAIETTYKNRLYRSRLEARWAVFFEAMQIPFDYEPEGFELPSGRYLPDFWIPGIKSWVEIKGTDPIERERRLATQLAGSTGSDVFVFPGQIRMPDQVPTAHYFYPLPDIPGEAGEDHGWSWFECEDCGWLGIKFQPPFHRPACPADGCEGRLESSSYKLTKAYRQAMTARFEFGGKA